MPNAQMYIMVKLGYVVMLQCLVTAPWQNGKKLKRNKLYK